MRHIFAGCEISMLTSSTKAGSLTCFLSRNDGHLYALTAKHCTDGMNGVVRAGQSVLGSVVEVTDGAEDEWDAALIKVVDNLAREIRAENLQAVAHGMRTTLRTVAAPDYNSAADQTLQVYHAGRSSEIHGGKDFTYKPGIVDIKTGTGADRVGRARVTMEMRVSRPGDSGGPIYTAGGELVGFVSIGVGEGRTRVILAHPVLAHFRATLATIGNEAQWRPPPIPDDSDTEGGDPFADPFGKGKQVWVRPF